MPIYQYRRVGTDQVVELIRSVDQRDAVPPGLERITVPERVTVVGAANPHTMESGARCGLKELEERGQLREVEQATGYSAKQLKKIWSDDYDKAA